MPGYTVTEPRVRCVLPFAAASAEVRPLRKAAVRQLSQWGVPVALDVAELLITELATNVVKHVGEGASAALALEWKGQLLRIEVHDTCETLPSSKAVECDDVCGRGLHLLTSLAVAWGTVPTVTGKAVWCEISATAEAACQRMERVVAALENYQAAERDRPLPGRGRDEDLAESVVRLIADLLHWSAARGHDPDTLLDCAQMHYEAEADAA
ncbi:ATP-binding protein [Streptomyces sp. B21-097]|uniref:ATP-binding protein n=1 Tax=Streptomyces sp. B21-097 TaxID=3039414 RepID=UPI002FEFA517